jgi:hypothetical protein
MLRLTSEPREDLSRPADNGWGERSAVSEWRRAGGPPVGLLVAGVAIVGLGILAWTYLGPDLKRYLKIHSM